MNVLLDTNVVLDVILERQPFAETSEQVFAVAKDYPVQLYLSATTVTDLFYISAKAKGKAAALALIEDLLKFVEVATVDKTVILDALRSGLPDFEDAVQAETAKQISAGIIVTRNKADFVQEEIIKICSPAEFVQLCEEYRTEEHRKN